MPESPQKSNTRLKSSSKKSKAKYLQKEEPKQQNNLKLDPNVNDFI